MKLRVTGGTLDVEIVEGSMSINDVKLLLKKLSKEEVVAEEIKRAGVSPHSSKSGMRDKLNAKPRMPI